MAEPFFIITDHAWQRFTERACLNSLLQDQIRQASPFGAQKGDSEYRLLPCGLVAVVSQDNGQDVVRTFLSKDHAIANMQASGIPFRQSPEPLPGRNTVLPVARGDRARLADMAREHWKKSVGRKGRNAALRESGFDPAGPEGDLYRHLYNEVVADERRMMRERHRALSGA